MKLVSWTIRASKELSTPEKTKAEVDRATKLLQEVIQNHPDTPWAQRAQWELKRPFGYTLTGAYRPIPKPPDEKSKPTPPPPKPPTPRKPTPPKPKPVKPKL
jgi:hypothetical protein